MKKKVLYTIKRRETINNAGNTIVEYKPLQGGVWNTLNDSGFITISLLNHYTTYYYNDTLNRVIESSALDSVFVFPDDFSYDPEHIPEISDGSYSLDFTDHEGYDTSFGDQFLKSFVGSGH